MPSPTSLPVARLRAMGCRVSTVVGHSPDIGDFIYSVRVPDSLGDLRERFTTMHEGYAKAEVPRISDGHHVVVKACLYRMSNPIPPLPLRREAERNTAAILTSLADIIERANHEGI